MAIRIFPEAAVTDYTAFRPQIEPGDLLLCSGSRPFSRAIQMVTRSPWSHVGFVMPLDAINRVMVLESVESIGVRTVPLSKYLNDYDNNGNSYSGGVVIARHKDFPSTNTAALQKLSQFAVDMFGYPYDNNEIGKIALRIIASTLTGVSGADDIRRDREYICSEYVYECYDSVGITISSNHGFITPADFANEQQVELQAVLKTP